MQRIVCICCLSIVFNCAIAQGVWTQKADFPGTARVSAVCFVIGSKAYVGPDGDATDFWEWDPSTNIWTQKANFPGISGDGRSRLSGFSIGNKGYLGIGISGQGSLYADFWEYDALTDTWTQIQDIAGLPRAYAVGFSLGSKGYVTTGLDYNGDTPYMWEYDPQNNSWTQRANFAGGMRSDAINVVCNGKAYVGTGLDTMENHDFWQYDSTSNTWTQMADFGGGGRTGAVAFSIGSKCYVGLGYQDASGIMNDMWEWDQATNTWSQIASLPAPGRSYGIAFSINGKGYVGLGAGNTDLWEFEPGGALEINSVVSSAAVKVYPNPASTAIHVQIPQHSSGSIELRDVMGNTIVSKNIFNALNEAAFDISSAAPGIYFVTVETNEISSTYKVVKQ